MTKRQQEEKARQIKMAAQETCRRIRVEMDAICHNPFCVNRHSHKVLSGKCRFLGGK